MQLKNLEVHVSTQNGITLRQFSISETHAQGWLFK